ncbi:MAG: CxxxxCH/CxxCH domain-containing protein [Myxococcota bacterium]
MTAPRALPPAIWAWALAGLFGLIAGCHRADETPAPLEGGCRSCHGGQSNAAPPRSVDGMEDTQSIGVGAHQSHVLGAFLGRPVACSECHLVPTGVDDPGHIDTPLPAEVIFGALASRAGASPSWSREAGTCSNTYCHGATLNGGSNPKPNWLVVNGSQASCGSCHGLPPPAPHPAATSCEACHGPVAGPDRTIAMPLRHADGVLDVVDVNNGALFSDPAHDVSIDALIPTYDQTSISALNPQTEILKMPMNHKTTAIPADKLSACTSCHPDGASGQYFPGLMHATLDDLGVAQPTECLDCHAASAPTGFVGPTATMPARSPPSGEMKHDAVLWANDAPTTMPAVPANCGACHDPGNNGGWTAGKNGPVTFHASLGNAQPSSCLDCHANTRPGMLNSQNASVPAGLSFDHGAPQALGDCQSCHSASRPGFTTWAGGRFHPSGSATPTSCLPCHESERPTTTNGWVSTTYTSAPFDYVQNSLGISHGAGQDCAECHKGPGTGQWGASPNWVNGSFAHASSPLIATTCINCHTTQRPDLLPGATPASAEALVHFDHSTNGRGDCLGCHQATVRAGSFSHLNNPATGTLPGGDWKDGIGYPGSTLVSSTTHFFTTTEIVLMRSGPNNLVTSTSQRTSTYPNAMLHTSSAMPAEVNAGPSGNPDNGKCWHCHTNNNGTVTSLSDGRFHASLSNYQATVGGARSALAQPTRCGDCHTVRPRDIVEKGGSSLSPMDHQAAFTAAVNIGGAMVSNAQDLDCAVCHRSAAGSTSWADGVFHANIGSAVPADCTGCHYPLLADGAKSDVTTGSRFSMKHRSAQITTQACATCHSGALAHASMSPPAASLWQTGAYHSAVSAQPASCNECHTVARPGATTAGSVSYTLSQGATATNQAQFMNHASQTLAGKDCAACHAADAKSSGSAWSKASKLHGPVPSAATCNECHGLSNGRGNVVGTTNNLPAGLNDSATVTTAGASTGVPTGTHDQITHTDVNVTANECKLCHTQQGSAQTGREWAQASFHRNFNASKPLTINGSTGRCSNCHMNVKPGAGYSQQDHSAFTATSQQDCSACHNWPGTSATLPNWLGATGAHASSGSTSGSSLACATCHGQGGSASTHLSVATASHYGGTSNGNTCISCHINFSGFGGTTANLKYAHTNSSANAGGCVTCHAFSNQLLATLTNTPSLNYPSSSGGHQFSQTYSVTGSFSGDRFTANHTNSGLTRCGACHQYSSTSASTNIWSFKHRPSNPGISNSTRTSGCDMCH